MCFEWYNERGDLQSYLGESKTEDEFVVVVVVSGVLWLRSIYFFSLRIFFLFSRDLKISITRARANFKAELTGDDVSRIERGAVSTTFALPLGALRARGVRVELCERRKEKLLLMCSSYFNEVFFYLGEFLIRVYANYVCNTRCVVHEY